MAHGKATANIAYGVEKLWLHSVTPAHNPLNSSIPPAIFAPPHDRYIECSLEVLASQYHGVMKLWLVALLFFTVNWYVQYYGVEIEVQHVGNSNVASFIVRNQLPLVIQGLENAWSKR